MQDHQGHRSKFPASEGWVEAGKFAIPSKATDNQQQPTELVKPLADAELAELAELAESAQAAYAAWEAEEYSVNKLDASDAADLELGARCRYALPGLLARLAAAETKLATYLPAPLPTGWLLPGEHEPEEEMRCEIELNNREPDQRPVYAAYWGGREGDSPIWTSTEDFKWWFAHEVGRYRYALTDAPEIG